MFKKGNNKMKKFIPTAIAASLTLILSGSVMAQDSHSLQTAPGYTATQTKGATLWSDNDNAIGVLGSLRLFGKTDSAHTQQHDIQNNDSRLGIAMRHNLRAGESDTSALGYYETGIHGLDSSTDGLSNNVYTRQAYAGVGSETLGILTFGKQYAPTDWGLGVDTTYAWGGKGKHDQAGMSTDIVNSAGIWYYTDDHLTVGVMAQGNDNVDKIGFADYGNGPDLHNAFRDGAAQVHNGAAMAARYQWENVLALSTAAAYNHYTVNSGLSQGCTPLGPDSHCYPWTETDGQPYDGNTYSMGMNAKYTTNVGDHAWYNGAQATWYVNKVDNVTSATRGQYRHNPLRGDDQETILGLEYDSRLHLTDNWSVYADVSWLRGGDAMEGQHLESTVLGTDYWLGKNAVTYVEYSYQKAWGNANDDWNIDDHLGAVGLRVFI